MRDFLVMELHDEIIVEERVLCEFVLDLGSPLLNCSSGSASPDAIVIDAHHSLNDFGGVGLPVGVEVAIDILQTFGQMPSVLEIVVIERIHDIGMIDELSDTEVMPLVFPAPSPSAHSLKASLGYAFV